MENELINKLESQLDKITQRWTRSLSREVWEGGPESRKKLLEIIQDHIKTAFHVLKNGNIEEASEYAEEVSHRAVGLKLHFPDLIKAFRLSKKLIMDQIIEEYPQNATGLAKAFRELDDVYSAFEIALARSHYRLEKLTSEEESSKSFKQDEELKNLRRRMSEVERAGKTLSTLGIQLLLLDNKRRILWANRSAKEKFKIQEEARGYTCGQARGVPDGICDDCPTTWAIRNKVLERGMVSLSRGRERSFYEVTAVPILNDAGEVEHVFELVQDVTPKFKLAEEKRQNEEYYRILFEHSGTAVIVLEPDKTISRVNRKFTHMSGYSRDEIENNKSFLDLVAEQERDRMARYHERRRVNPTGAPATYEFTFVTKKGDERRASINVGLVPGTMQSICSIRDVTEEEQIKEFLEAVLYGSVDAIIGLDVDYKIVSWNMGAEDLFGYRTKEILDRPFSILWPQDELQLDKFQEIAQTLQKKGSIRNYETALVTRAGTQLMGNLTMSLLRDKLGKPRGYSVIVHDVTEQKALEQQVIHAEKLAAIGQLTAGLAHEMGTPLNIVSGRAEYLLTDFSDNDPRKESLEIIIHQTERMTKLIDNLLKFSRPQKVKYSKLDISEVIEGVINLLETQLDKSGISVDFRIPQDIPLIEGDYNQLQQVFLNLILNSIQAMPTGGQLTLDIKPTESGSLRIMVSDLGTGIDPKNLPRIFEPFFTTKDSGQGTGLGLAIVWKIIKDHNGYIEVDSQPGEGAAFTLTLPVCQSHTTSIIKKD